MKRISVLLCCLSLALALDSARAGITASLEPAQIDVGETAELTVTVDGANSAEPSIPNVAGLDIAHVAQSTQIQVINGSMTTSSVQTYEITARHGGTFTIPAIEAGGAKSRPLTLRVAGPGGANPTANAPQNSGGGAPLPPPNVQMPPADDASPADTRYGFLQLAVPKKDLFVGELVPVDVEAFVPGRETVTDLPALTSDAFTLNPLGTKPERDERVVDGREYTVFTWHSALTAVKPGDFSLSMQMPVTVIVPQQQPQRRQRSGNDLFDQLFNDPFFNNSFGRGVKKAVTLTNEPAAVTVQALPKANRPANFSGAIGHFDVHASASPTSVAAGDPITLRLELSGAGNFDRASTDLVGAGKGWKTYPPKSTFQPADSASYQGTKTFEQLIIPEDASVKEIPALRFSFFDPKTRQYETRTTAPIPVSVTGAPANVAAANASAPSGPASAAPVPAPLDLVPNKVEAGHFVASLRPVFLAPWFVAAQGLPLCALAGGLLFLRRRRRFAADPRFARAGAAERAINGLLDRMDQAMREHSSVDFFFSARGALQQRLGERWNVRPETITLADVTARLNGAAEGIRPIFEMADQVSYSGQNLGDADYRHWKDLVVAQLKELEKQS